MSVIESKATNVTPPGEVYVRASTAAGEVLELATSEWQDSWITVQAVVDDAYIKFSTTSAGANTLVAAASTDVASSATTPVNAAVGGCFHIPAGTTQSFFLGHFVKNPGEGIFMAHRASAATPGTVRFYRSSGPRAL